MKQCIICKETKSLSEFANCWRNDDGKRDDCRKCVRKEYDKNRGSSVGYWDRQKRIKEIKLMERECGRRRRAMKLKIKEHYTARMERKTRDAFNNQCFNCGTTERLSIDHHYPLSKGYALSLSNAVVLCRSCNSSKNNKMPEDFYTLEQLCRLYVMLEDIEKDYMYGNDK